MPIEFLTLAQAAELTGLSIRTIQRHIRSGNLPAAYLGGSRLVRIKREDLDNLFTPTEPTAAGVVDAIERAVSSAPPLTPEQRARLTALFWAGE
jgi:excisionase family DNA binding protein